MKKNITITVSFDAEFKERLPAGTEAEKVFWQHLLKDPKALVDFYLWFYMAPMEEVPEYREQIKKLTSVTEEEIIEHIISKLPAEAAAPIKQSLANDTNNGYRERLVQLVLNQFVNPQIHSTNIDVSHDKPKQKKIKKK
ncbi:MAG: hypothetical protein GY765_16295 [bacterium]|nr:hypothetical protein [bacterium]